MQIFPLEEASKTLVSCLREALKENIDGEALEWSFKRILSRPEKEKSLW